MNMEKSLLVVCVLQLLLAMFGGVAAEKDRGDGPIVPRRRTVQCTLPEFPACFRVRLLCPLACPISCFLDCTLCRPLCTCLRPGAVCQDPRFVGGDGITFYFHGKQNRDFCLVTDPDLHINAHFIGRRNPGMKRDFTWVQSLDILLGAHRIFVAAKKTAAWDDASDRLDLAFDGEPVSLPLADGASWRSSALPAVSIRRTRATNAVAVEAEGKFAIVATVVPITEEESRVHRYNITADDCFAHLDLGFKLYGLSDGVDGVLGQTYRSNYTSRAKMGVPMPVLGGDREFTSSSLFAADCAASRFVQGTVAAGVNGGKDQRPSLQCTGGHGVFCKR